MLLTVFQILAQYRRTLRLEIHSVSSSTSIQCLRLVSLDSDLINFLQHPFEKGLGLLVKDLLLNLNITLSTKQTGPSMMTNYCSFVFQFIAILTEQFGLQTKSTCQFSRAGAIRQQFHAKPYFLICCQKQWVQIYNFIISRTW